MSSRPAAVLLISISTEALPPRARHQAADSANIESVLHMLAEHAIAATWIVAGAQQQGDVSRAIAHCQRQEVAFWSSLAGSPAQQRPSQVATLRQQLLRSRETAAEVSTIFSTDSAPADVQELLVKYGVTAVCPLGTERAAGLQPGHRIARAAQWLLPLAAHAVDVPRKVRWGLWQMPLPTHLAQTGTWGMRHAIDRTVASAGLMHLHVDLATICAAGRRALQQVESVLRQVASYQANGRLSTQTVQATTAALSRPRTMAPARSILRRQAA